MLNYQTNDPRGWGGNPRRGAALGRPNIKNAPKKYRGPLFVSRVKMCGCCGAYDTNGTYFGVGEPIYWVHDEEGEVDFTTRASSREEARDLALESYPQARIRR